MNPLLKLAHYVVNTNKVVKMRDWYSTVLNAEVVFENDMMCFITYDDEHHRLAFMTPPGGATEKPINSTGLMHAAFTFPNLRNLLEHYTYLKSLGIASQVPVKHGPTTSLCYRDPDDSGVGGIWARYASSISIIWSCLSSKVSRPGNRMQWQSKNKFIYFYF